jgi:3-carboxy-cis,cis-muconate cycloisomerase
MSSQELRTRPSSTPAMMAVFDDASAIAHALAFEAALARALAFVGQASEDAAQGVARACNSLVVDPIELAGRAAHAGTLAIPLVTMLKEKIGHDAEASATVHRGATSQDLSDTVMMLQLRDGASLLMIDLARIMDGLASLARRYIDTAAVGRTMLQNALPITVGLRVAQWLAGIYGATRRFERACAEDIVLQFGGPVGTFGGLEGRGQTVHDQIAKEMGLKPAVAPWHARRDGVASIATNVAVLIGMIGKMARDISFLSQDAIGEAYEPRIVGRGGSSAMGHKRNPTGCQVALSAATRAPGLVASILSGLPQEQERGLGGWQAEWPALAELFMVAGGSAASMADAIEGLVVDEAAVARNLGTANIGHDIGEARRIVDKILAEYEDRT